MKAVCTYGGSYGINQAVLNVRRRNGIVARAARHVRKLTVEVPADLLQRATMASGEGVTPTVRRGLELVAAGGAYARLRRLRGKVKFGIKLSELRQD